MHGQVISSNWPTELAYLVDSSSKALSSALQKIVFRLAINLPTSAFRPSLLLLVIWHSVKMLLALELTVQQ